MGWGRDYSVQIFNGLDEEKQPRWYTLQRFDNLDRAGSRAKAQSKKNPDEIYRLRNCQGYSQVSKYDKYFIGGEMVAYCIKEWNKEWRGDARPELPERPEIQVWELHFNEVSRNVDYVAKTPMYSVAALIADNTGRGYPIKYRISQAERADGKMFYFAYGSQVESLIPHIQAFEDKLKWKDALMVSKDLSYQQVTHTRVEFSLGDFQQTNRKNIVYEFNRLDEMCANMAALAQNDQAFLADVARIIHVAVEDIKKYASVGDNS